MTSVTTSRTVTVTTKFGPKSVVTSLTIPDAVKVIQDDPKASDFARDLVYKGGRWGLSPKQNDWLVYLAQESLDKASRPATVALAPAVVDVKALFTLFGQARLSLKYPRLRLQDASGRLVVIKLSGSGSKHCGSLNITNGEKFGDPAGVFHGYVHQDGSCTVKDQGVLDLLQTLASDPAGVAASQGLASGECCCCGKALSDSEAGSSEIGYGPVCAKNWGLPWQANGKAEPVAPVKVKRARKAKVAVSA